ncbi:helix-turn-helix transcriptional regulator [Paratractidigestivibacter sp.]|uniref:helix-turn-helix domain-containing protein n=1 Tax=Paratractidigestivibacter sp. TaxID=2847316 RepID=UPI002ABE1584|nr:helix-turn-helix transcriptional regulator [Paratractidigestivibacter sp.]
MKVRTGKSLESLKGVKLSDDSLALEHRLDISASIYKRMKELGLNQKELARKLGMNEAQVSRIIRGKQNLTIASLAKIENALDFALDGGFRYRGEGKVFLSMVYERNTAPSSWDRPNTWSDSTACSNEPIPVLEVVA